MIKDYLLYYDFNLDKNCLFVCFDCQDLETLCVKQGNVETVYDHQRIIGYHILDVNKYIKIHSKGVIFRPSEQLVVIINNCLDKEGLEKLAFNKDSGFLVGFLQQNGSILLKNEIRNTNILGYEGKVVVCNKGKILGLNKKANEETHLCTFSDLDIEENNDNLFIFNEEIENGSDFFGLEEATWTK